MTAGATGYIGAIGIGGGGGGMIGTTLGGMEGHRRVTVLIHDNLTSAGLARFVGIFWGWAKLQYSLGLNGITTFLQYPGAGSPQFGNWGDGIGAAIGDLTKILKTILVNS